MRIAFFTLKKFRPMIDDMDCLNPEDINQLFNIYSELEAEQLMALTTLIKTDIWMENVLLFENLVLILNGVSPAILSLEGVTCKQIWYALFIMSKLRNDLNFSELVKEYIKFEHSEEGFLIYPRESGLDTPLKQYMPEIYKLADLDRFAEDNLLENQASKFIEILEYVDRKRKEDGI